MYRTFKNYIRLFTILSSSFYFTGCLKKDTSVSPLERSITSNESIKEVNYSPPSKIVVYPDVRDLVNGTNIQKNYSSNNESAVLMYSANDIKTNKAIQSVQWTYGGKVTKGWTFKAYMNKNIGSDVSLEIKDTHGYTHTDSFTVSFQDTCGTISHGEDYSFCLRTDQIETDGDYLKGGNENILFYLSHGDSLEDNISNARAYIEYEDSKEYGESIEITDLITFQGQNLVINPLSLTTLDIDPMRRIFVRLMGDYNSITAPYNIQTTTASSRAFLLGTSNLNLNFDDSVIHLNIISSTARFGRIETGLIGTSFNLSSIPAGTYTIEAQSKTKTSFATIFVNALESVDVNFSMQSKDPLREGRILISESFSVKRVSINSLGGVNSFSTPALPVPKVNDLQVVSLTSPHLGPFTLSRFKNNFKKIKEQFLEDENAPLPTLKTNLYHNYINGSVQNYKPPKPNKFIDKDIALKPGHTYMHFIYGEHPLLFRARSMRALEQSRENCISNQNTPVSDCVRSYNNAVSTWDAFESISSHIDIDIRYTVTGKINGIDQEIVYDYKFSSRDFVNENGGIESASLKRAFSSNMGNGWLLQKPKQIFIPENMTEPKVTAELLTPFPKDITRGNEAVRKQNFWVNLSVGLVDIQRAPSIAQYLQHDGVNDVKANKVKSSKLHANLLTGTYKMFPVHASTKAGEYYHNKNMEVEFLIEIDKVDGYEIKGVWGHIRYKENLYPNTKEGIKEKVQNFIMIDNKKATFTLKRVDFFGVDKLPFDYEDEGILSFELGLVIVDKKHPELGEQLGPLGKILEFQPHYNITNKSELPYSKDPKLYSTPNFTHAKRKMTNLFSILMRSSLYNSNTSQNKLFYNDASLPFGGKNKNHSGHGHKKGYGLDLRYPAINKPNSVENWDQSRRHYNNEGIEDKNFDVKFCDLNRNLQTGYSSTRLYHGHNKIKAMKRYLWIKRYASEVNSLYSDLFAPEYQNRSLKNENLNGDLLIYITDTFCLAQSPMSSPCTNLVNTNTIENKKLVLDLISYIAHARAGIDTMTNLGKDINKIFISAGEKSMPCFPKKKPGIDFTYTEQWHQNLFENGKMPDGASAGIGTWKNKEKIKYDLNTRFHMSHIHINVNR